MLILSASMISSTACVKLSRDPSSAAVQTTQRAATDAAENARRVNLNTASLKELERLPAIGPALAARIIAHRERYGPFRRAEQLMMVRGISDRRFREMRALLTVE